MGGWNCRHSYHPFFPGYESAYSDDILKEYQRKTCTYNGEALTDYEASQQQRYFERGIRRWKREYTAMDAAGLDTTQASVKLKQWREKEADFLKQTGRRRDSSRSQIGTFGRSEAGKATWQAQEYYNVWSKSIGVKESIKTLAKYYDVKYNDSPRYELLQGYTRAVRKGDISPLVGFARYEEVAGEVKQTLVGVQTATGVTIDGFTSHFVDRIIGQTSTSHAGMRKGVPIEDALYTLTNPSKSVKERTCADGDIRQTLQSEKCTVTYSVRDRKLIQTNPQRRKDKNGEYVRRIP